MSEHSARKCWWRQLPIAPSASTAGTRRRLRWRAAQRQVEHPRLTEPPLQPCEACLTHIRLSVYVFHEATQKWRAGVPLQDIGRSYPVAFAQPARMRRDVRLRTDRDAPRGTAESFPTPRPPETRRAGGSAARRKMDALPVGTTRPSTRSPRPPRITRVDGKR